MECLPGSRLAGSIRPSSEDWRYRIIKRKVCGYCSLGGRRTGDRTGGFGTNFTGTGGREPGL
jgi:hypothetical protein